MTQWNLYRYRNHDGTSKDWAVTTNADGSITTRWGRTAQILPSSGTRTGVSQSSIERQKRDKGYVFVAEVEIDQDGKVTFPNQAPKPEEDTDTNPVLQADDARSVVDTVYWHVDCQADHDTCVVFGIAVRRLLGVIQDCEVLFSQPEQEWDGWQLLIDLTLEPKAFSQGGQIRQAHGFLPWLWLMALKHRGFTGIEIGMATENSREISADIREEPEVLAFFGVDLETVRPACEMLELLKPKLNLALALAGEDDSWF
jgi:hypothetical protein